MKKYAQPELEVLTFTILENIGADLEGSKLYNDTEFDPESWS